MKKTITTTSIPPSIGDLEDNVGQSTSRTSIALLIGSIVVVLLINQFDIVVSLFSNINMEPLAFWGIPLAVVAIIILYRLDETSSSADLGLSRPKSWKKTIMVGLAFGGINFGIGFILQVLVLNLGLPSPDYSSSTFSAIQGDYATLARHLLVAWTTAGFGEEIIWRGFFMERVARIFGNKQKGWIVGLISSSIVFGLIHSYQGITGIIFTGIGGLVLGIMYLKTNRNLYTTVIGHGVNNTVLFLMMFFL